MSGGTLSGKFSSGPLPVGGDGRMECVGRRSVVVEVDHGERGRLRCFDGQTEVDFGVAQVVRNRRPKPSLESRHSKVVGVPSLASATAALAGRPPQTARQVPGSAPGMRSIRASPQTTIRRRGNGYS